MNRGLLAVLIVTISTLLMSACAPVATVAPGSEPGALGVLIDALRAAGATVEPVHEIRQPFLSVPGKVLTVNGVEIQVYEYTDEAAMRAEAETISSDGSTVGTTVVTWVDAPHFFATGRLIVVYVGTESWLLELLGKILGQPIAVGVGTRP